MSLLDFKMPGLDTAEGQGIMAAALSLLQAQKMPGQRGLAGALGGAGQQYMQTSGQARQQAMQSKLQGAQLAQYEALNKERERKFLEEQAAAAERKRVDDLLAGAGRVPKGMGAGLPADALPPEMQIGQVPALRQPGKIDFQGLYQQGVPFDRLKDLAGSSDLGRAKIKNIETLNINGKPMKVGIDEFGQQVAQIGMEWKPLEFKDFGGDVRSFDPANPDAGFKSVGQKTVDPGTIYSGGITMRGQNMADSRARDLNAIAVEGNNIKRGEKKATEDMTKNSQIASFDTMLGTLDRLASHPGLSRSVGVSGMFPTMPGSESANFQAELDTFQSQAFIPMVAQLKGMGALSDAEGKKLTAAVGALNPKMGEAAFRASVGRITKEMEAARERVSGSARPDSMPPAKAPMKGQTIDGYKFMGGDPADKSNWVKQ